MTEKVPASYFLLVTSGPPATSVTPPAPSVDPNTDPVSIVLPLSPYLNDECGIGSSGIKVFTRHSTRQENAYCSALVLIMLYILLLLCLLLTLQKISLIWFRLL